MFVVMSFVIEGSSCSLGEEYHLGDVVVDCDVAGC